ncbi:class I SAM-dependent methyltransferase [Motilimonas pumila]|uniref:Class I SAM-dependent methyltransferase n=1 Tax=Motilimonas pumila TaxID=2303987 RepID=A0A418YGS1_9GAMM|nr:class I SAM-dependent methyltransferase [Motilimonas pumila]RJG49004.1 class I SAM-dependent methyltransferase [Motilimonas pumila]
MTTYFDAYGERAATLENHTQIAGRYAIQHQAEKHIVQDLINKLSISSKDTLLEVGCGTGNLLIPLSFFTKKCVGIDHPGCIKKLSERTKSDNLELLAGDFLSLKLPREHKFDVIVIYSVLHCLRNSSDVMAFIDKAVALLAPGGRLILGDLPNNDLKQRFVNSQEGQRFSVEWREAIADMPEEPAFEPVSEAVSFDDESVLSLLLQIRQKGLEAHLLPQPSHLPFGHTREDIVVRKYC